MVGAASRIRMVNKMLVKLTNRMATTRMERIRCSSFFASASETNLEMATGIPPVVITMMNNRMGKAIWKRPTPSSPIIRERAIR